MEASSSCRYSRVKASSAPNGSSMRSKVGVTDEGPGQPGPLLLAAGQLARVEVRVVAQSDQLQLVVDVCRSNPLGKGPATR